MFSSLSCDLMNRISFTVPYVVNLSTVVVAVTKENNDYSRSRADEGVVTLSIQIRGFILG